MIAIYVITKFPGNPITGRAIGVQPNEVVVEAMEAAFIGLAAAILAIESRKTRVPRAETAGA